jgi:hypothetical protein
LLEVIKTLVNTAPLVYPGSGYSQAKHCLRGLAFAGASSEWFKFLQTPELAVIVRNRPSLFQKLQQPYLHRDLDACQRLAALRQHYHFVATCFSPALQNEVYATPGKLIASLPLTGLGNFGLCLSYSRHLQEGDLLISLINLDTGVMLFSLTFSITRFESGTREIFIGGLQGNKLANHRELIVAITRQLHGLRPKALLLFPLQQLAAIWGITRLRAVSDKKHVYRHWRNLKQVPISGYDRWWLESGGRLAADGLFDLPATFIPRQISRLKAGKRQMYKRRYRMLAEIAEQISAAYLLEPFKSGSAGAAISATEIYSAKKM